MDARSPIAGLDLNLLIALKALLDTHSVTLAAGRVGVTQSAMSRSLGRLRVVLDDPLFLRRGRALEPTPRALDLEQPLDELLAILEHRILAPPHFDPRTSDRQFRIVGADIVDLTLVPRIFRALQREAPHTTLQVLRVVPEADQPEPDILFGPATLHETVPFTKTWRHQPLFVHRFVSLVRADHPVLDAAWDLDAFLALDHALVSPLGGPVGLVDHALRALGRQRRVALWTTNFGNLGPVLETTDLVGTLPDSQARFLCEHFAVRELTTPLELAATDVYAFWFPRLHDDPGHRWFRGLVARLAADTERRDVESA